MAARQLVSCLRHESEQECGAGHRRHLGDGPQCIAPANKRNVDGRWLRMRCHANLLPDQSHFDEQSYRYCQLTISDRVSYVKATSWYARSRPMFAAAISSAAVSALPFLECLQIRQCALIENCDNTVTSASGPGCTKTCLSQGCAELLSQFPSLDRAGKCNWFSHRQNREGISKRKLNVRVFTQPGSKTVLTAPERHFRSAPMNRHCLAAPTCLKRANRRHRACGELWRNNHTRMKSPG